MLMLLTAMTRQRELGVEQLSVYAAKSHSLDLAEWLEDDIATLGSNFDSTITLILHQVCPGRIQDRGANNERIVRRQRVGGEIQASDSQNRFHHIHVHGTVSKLRARCRHRRSSGLTAQSL